MCSAVGQVMGMVFWLGVLEGDYFVSLVIQNYYVFFASETSCLK